MFHVRELDKVKPPSETQEVAFHHTVVQLLFVSARVIKDIQKAVDFLTTGFKYLDEYGWGKLKRLLKYLKGTRHMKFTFSFESVSMIRWRVDASYNVHDRCKGHTG